MGEGTDVGAWILIAMAEKKMGQPLGVGNTLGAATQVEFNEFFRQKPEGSYRRFVLLPQVDSNIIWP